MFYHGIDRFYGDSRPMTPEQQQEIAELRDRDLSPKQIARKLGLRPAEVSAVIQTQAKSAAVLRLQRDELPPLVHCLLDEEAASHLLDRVNDRDPTDQAAESSTKLDPGIAQLWVVRSERNAYLVGSYLVDYWCLGVKNTFGPRKITRRDYEGMIRDATRQVFNSGFREISLEQAQSIIFGAVDYASQYGLKPHRDFERSRVHLGKPIQPLHDIEFGRDGKPCYVSGPNDNPTQILNLLRDVLEEDDFNYVTPI